MIPKSILLTSRVIDLFSQDYLFLGNWKPFGEATLNICNLGKSVVSCRCQRLLINLNAQVLVLCRRTMGPFGGGPAQSHEADLFSRGELAATTAHPHRKPSRPDVQDAKVVVTVCRRRGKRGGAFRWARDALL